MGKLIYNASGHSFDIEDRSLSHLRIVFMNKLRRGEPFMFHHGGSDGTGSRSLWIHPAISLVFHFYGSRQPALNHRWIDGLMREANGPGGLTVVPEPDSDEPADS